MFLNNFFFVKDNNPQNRLRIGRGRYIFCTSALDGSVNIGNSIGIIGLPVTDKSPKLTIDVRMGRREKRDREGARESDYFYEEEVYRVPLLKGLYSKLFIKA